MPSADFCSSSGVMVKFANHEVEVLSSGFGQVMLIG
jgi:hypothetical protein